MTIHIIIKFIILSIIAYSIIKLMLSNQNNFSYKRTILLLTPAIVFIASYFSFANSEVIELTNFQIIEDIVVGSQSMQSISNPFFRIVNLYFLGLAIFLIIRVIGFIRLSILYRDAKRDNQYSKLKVYKTPKSVNLSFGDRILINNRLTKTEEKKIIEHERVHIEKKHSIDLLIYNFYCIVFWFNPIVHLMFKELKLTHEFEVDAELEVKDIVTAPDQRLKLVYNKIASNYNFNNIKRRLEMRHNSNNKRTPVVFASIAIVLLSLTFALTAPDIAISSEKAKTEATPPTYKGDLMSELSQEIKYPKELAKKGIEGRTIVNLTIGKDGSVKAHGITQSSGNLDLDKEALRAALTLKKWNPGEKDGKKVTAITQIPIKFKLDKKKEK